MSEITPPAGDRQLEVFNRFDGDLRAQINSLITAC